MDMADERCVFCLDKKSHPKFIRCGHAFCRKCIIKYIRHANQHGYRKRCPICRRRFWFLQKSPKTRRVNGSVTHAMNIQIHIRISS
ncbi:E3 ubiquitin-protein ligase RNF170-like [Teleopsis dalmanni]|uniref:E3 ubiquitin-protein ligase RNF170-like n=1 Tax=Teleopsis dalmanni TaxID=139649 RepID=UPI0018CF31D9|nr:E3 ubiquitin-protein ligase RNF170-like [Teleopsis dalmanni]